MKVVIKIFNVLLIIVGLATIGLFAYSKTTGKTLFQTYIVQSGSMEPTIKTGSVIFSVPSNTYAQGDIITFYRSPDAKTPVTHRINYKLFPEGVYNEPIYMTSGDANEDFDKQTITNDQIVGKVAYSIPYLGYIADFAKTPKGFVLLVIIPATIIVYEELKYLSGSALTGIKSKINKRQKSQPSSNKGSASYASIIPVLGAALIFANISASYFSNTETSQNNRFQAGEWVTPINSGDIVINEVYYHVHVSHQITDSNGEWIELYNKRADNVSLDGWSISDNNLCDNLSGTIKANNYAIITNATKTNFEAVWGSLPSDVLFISLSSDIGNGLADAGDRAILTNGICTSGTPGTGSIIDQISWGTDSTVFTSPLANSGSGNSWERDPDGTDTDTAGDFIKRTTPLPGS